MPTYNVYKGTIKINPQQILSQHMGQNIHTWTIDQQYYILNHSQQKKRGRWVIKSIVTSSKGYIGTGKG